MLSVPQPSQSLKAPFPYFGGKSRIAAEVWKRFGNPPNYVEPFAGSLAALLARPHTPQTETVNDKDGMISNFWRALQAEPETVARYADWPVNENDLHARHAWLVGQRESLTARLEGDPDYYDPKIAGWWVWGVSSWIGSGWCSGRGPWQVVDRELRRVGRAGAVARQLPRMSGAQGVNRKLPHIAGGNRGGHRDSLARVVRQLPHVAGLRGVHREVLGTTSALLDYFAALAARLRRVRVCSGDWSRVLTPTVTTYHGPTAVFLDPPYIQYEDWYSEANRVAHTVHTWAVEHGNNPLFRIALCGYEGDYTMPEGWICLNWKAQGGYARTKQAVANSSREVVWFSPHCLEVA
jgi:hypothetical protein